MIQKAVAIDIIANTITVTVTVTVGEGDPPSYPADSATVTAKKLPNGNPESIPLKTPGSGTAVFEKGGLASGFYNVAVECSQTVFARAVLVQTTVEGANEKKTVNFSMLDENPAPSPGAVAEWPLRAPQPAREWPEKRP
jgi:hypothetical protein